MVGRVRRWIRFRRDRGESLSRTLAVHVPRRAVQAVTDAIYRGVYALPPTAWRRRFEDQVGSCGGRPWFLIAVPDTLHTVLPCVALARRSVPLVVLGNGLRAWEAEALRAVAPRFLELPALPGTMVPHGVVLRVLIELADGDLGLHDPDLFVFRTSLYGELRPRDGEIAVGLYGVVNRKTALHFPTTHLLALDGAAARDLCRRHAITPDTYRRTPARWRAPLAAIGIGDHNFPKDYLRFYDACTLLWAVALLENRRTRSLPPVPSEDAWHVGGISYDRTNPRLRYVHARFLDLEASRPFRARYWGRLVGRLTAGDLQRGLIRAGSGAAVQAIDAGVERVVAALRH